MTDTNLNIDFSQAQEFAMVAPGAYPVLVEDVEIAQSPNTGNYYLKFVMIITEGEFENSKLWMNSPLSPKGLGITKGNLKALGVSEEALNGSLDIPELIPQLINQRCTATVEHREYEGEQRVNVKKLIKSDETKPIGATGPAGARSRKRG